MAADQDVIRLRLGYPRCHRAHTRLRHQFDPDLRPRVDLPQVVDELGQVLDAVDVVVGWRRDQWQARHGVAQPGDEGRHLEAGQLPALARFRPLGDLDLQFLSPGQVVGGDAKPAGGDLLHL